MKTFSKYLISLFFLFFPYLAANGSPVVQNQKVSSPEESAKLGSYYLYAKGETVMNLPGKPATTIRSIRQTFIDLSKNQIIFESRGYDSKLQEKTIIFKAPNALVWNLNSVNDKKEKFAGKADVTIVSNRVTKISTYVPIPGNNHCQVDIDISDAKLELNYSFTDKAGKSIGSAVGKFTPITKEEYGKLFKKPTLPK